MVNCHKFYQKVIFNWAKHVSKCLSFMRVKLTLKHKELMFHFNAVESFNTIATKRLILLKSIPVGCKFKKKEKKKTVTRVSRDDVAAGARAVTFTENLNLLSRCFDNRRGILEVEGCG